MTEKEIEAVNYRPYPGSDDAVVFPTLADSELAVLEALGTRRSVAVGEYLYREGDIAYDFYVILSGAVEIVVHSDGEERIIARHEPGRFLGELNLLSGQPGEVLVVPRAALQHVIATNPGLGDTILAATSPSELLYKPRSSAPTSPARVRPPRCGRRPGIWWSACRTGPRSPGAL